MIRVKICCIASIGEAQMAIDSGASAIGLVGKMPSGPGPIPDELIREIAFSIPPPLSTFLLTSETTPENIASHHSRTLTSTIQIVDMPVKGTYEKLRVLLPSVKLVQVIHVMDERSVETAISISGEVDALLLDSGNPTLKIKELGGTGRVHNWKLSREISKNSRCPVFLAGGLNPQNVRQAIEEVDPFGIDVCSGVRTGGALDRSKLSEFMANIISTRG
jgi:phosphoribosylanthranilate isomerase